MNLKTKPAPLYLNKRSITLLELLIALTLVFTVGSGIGVKLYQGLSKARFETTIDQVKEVLERAEESVLSNFSPILFFEEKGGEFLLRFSDSEGKLPDKQFLLKEILSLKWNGSSPPFQLEFVGYGTIYPEGTLVLSSGESEVSLYLESPIQSVEIGPPFQLEEP